MKQHFHTKDPSDIQVSMSTHNAKVYVNVLIGWIMYSSVISSLRRRIQMNYHGQMTKLKRC